MLIKKSFLGFLAAILLGACSSDDGGTDGSIVLNGGTETSQIIYANETQKNEGIKFTATEPWTATVNVVNTRADGSRNVDWLKLSAYSGGAGEFTLNLMLTTNTTGKSRKAEIRIAAGQTVLIITVEQKAETESGEEVVTAKPIKKFTCRIVYNSDKIYNSEDYIYEILKEFSYDEQGRMSRIVTSNPGSADSGSSTMTFDYTKPGEITLKEVEYNGNTKYYDTYLVKLNEQGNVTSIQDDDKSTGTYSDYIRFSYTDDGRLAQWKDADAGSETSSGTFSYSNGMLSKYEYVEGKSPEENRTIVLNMDKAYTNRYPNNFSMDIVGLLLSDDDDYDFVFYAGRTGKTSDYLPELIPDFSSRDNWEIGREEGYPIPNTSFEKSYYSIKWADDDLEMKYTFDKDNNLTGIQTQRGFTVMKTTYTVVVGNELVHPESPDYAYYKYDTKDHKTVKEKDDVDILTWTIEY